MVLANKKSIFISPIELQIAYKEEVLKTEKDLEDVLYLREVFKGKINERKIEKFKKVIKGGQKRIH